MKKPPVSIIAPTDVFEVQTIKEQEPMDVQAYLDASVTGLTNPTKSKRLPMSLKDYIELVNGPVSQSFTPINR